MPRITKALPKAAPKKAALRAALILALSWGAAPAPAQDEGTLRFTARIAGLTAGRMTLTYRTDGRDYALSARTTSAGLAGLFRSFTFANSVTGTETAEGLMPRRYQARSQGGRSARETALAYDRGVPEIVTLDDDPAPGTPKVDPAGQGGTVDPLTLTWVLLRDIPADRACQLDLRVFDGRRVAQMRQRPGAKTDTQVECLGVYSRVAGYPAEDLARRRDIAFSVIYRPLPDGRLRVVELTLDSFFGPARMLRED